MSSNHKTSKLFESIGPKNNEDFIKLIEEIEDINSCSKKKERTALHQAGLYNNIPAIEKLVSISGINLNAKDYQGRTPLHCACLNNKYQAVTKLLETPGVDVNATDIYGETPLHLACSNNSDEAVDVLLKTPGVDTNASNDCTLSTPLHLACINKNHQIVAKLVNVPSVDVNARDECGDTPLHRACSCDNYAVFKVLIDLPAIDVNAVNDSGKTPLHLICGITTEYANRSQAVEKLLANPRIEVNIKDKDGVIPIIVAASNCDVDSLKLLINYKHTDLDAKNNDGKGLDELISESGGDAKSECLDIIQEARRIRECAKIDQKYEGHDYENLQVDQELDNMRARIRNQYIEKIEEINKKKKKVGLKLKRNAEIKEVEIERMIANQHIEKETMKVELDKVKIELEQRQTELQEELAEIFREHLEIQQKITNIEKKAYGQSQEMNQRHAEEKMALEEKHKCKNKDSQKALDNLMEISEQLTKEMNKLDIDSNDLESLKEAREILECPICMEMMVPPKRIWRCRDSHNICEDCKDKLDGNKCPTCRSEDVSSRALTAEKFARALFHQSM